MRKSFLVTAFTGLLYTSLTFAEGFTLSLDREYDPSIESHSHAKASPRKNSEDMGKSQQTFFRAINHTSSTITLGSEESTFPLKPGKAMLLKTTPDEGKYYSSIPVKAESSKILEGRVMMSTEELPSFSVTSGHEIAFHFYTRDQLLSHLIDIEQPKKVILARDATAKSVPQLDEYNTWLSNWSSLLSYCDPFQPDNTGVVSSDAIHQFVRSLLDLPEETIFIRHDLGNQRNARSGCFF